MKNIIKKLLREGLLHEDTTFDKRMYLKKWYEQEMNNLKDWIDTNYSDSNLKLYKYKQKKLSKIYDEKNKELESEKNPYGHEGNINASVIYHYTTGHNLINIINTDTIMSGGEGISFSTSGNLYKQGFVFWGEIGNRRDDENVGIKIKLDFNAMKDDGYNFYIGSGEKGTYTGEYEIRFNGGAIDNVRKYLKEVYVFKDKEEHFKEIINFLDNKNIKYSIINNDKPIYREKENEFIRQEDLIRDKKNMENELRRVIDIYKILYKKTDAKFLKKIEQVLEFYSDGFSKLFSQNQIGYNLDTDTMIKHNPDYYKEIDINTYNEINKYYNLIDKISTNNNEIEKILEDNIKDFMKYL
jgi:hypothetical protein